MPNQFETDRKKIVIAFYLAAVENLFSVEEAKDFAANILNLFDSGTLTVDKNGVLTLHN